ncbi:MAG: hypothetical protein ABEI97_05450 [Candidatus Nanohaloarchaea archaeon]|nr:hypothetical protein [Candidatus Nanohaloarchaea archaeon]
MPRWQVWEYGYGDGGRMHFHAPTPEKAVKAFLERQVASGKTYRQALEDRGQEAVKVCVKDPSVEGTRQNPNYPDVHTYELQKEWVEA